MTAARLELTREQILGFRRSVSHLDQRLPRGARSLRQAAWAGLSDSMPRAALLSIYARVAGTKSDTLEDASLAQVWGPRFSAYVVAEQDAAVFTLGRMPSDDGRRRRAEAAAENLDAFLAGRTMTYGEAGHALGVDPNSLRYGTTTGRIRIRWEGARQPTVWMVPAPDMDVDEARLELARRYVHVLGPGTPEHFADWAGRRAPGARATFEALLPELTPVHTPVGEGWILTSDEAAIRAPIQPTGGPRLLPSGDTFFLLWGADRELLVPEARRRAELWTSRVWPGCLLVDGEPAGIWRRADALVVLEPWRRFTRAECEAVEAEVASFPLAGLEGRMHARWVG